MSATTPTVPRVSDFLWRFGVAGAGVMALLAVMSPLRGGFVWFTVWSVESSARLVRLDAWSYWDGLMMFASASGRTFSYRIVEECTATAVVGLFTVAVLAMPAVAWRRRLAGVVVGSVVLLAANWVRLLSLAWLGVHVPAVFDFAHVWMWQFVSLALVAVVWLIWLRWATGQPGTGGNTPRRAAWFAGTVAAAGGLFHVAGLTQRYSDAIGFVMRGAQAALDALPYQTVFIAGAAGEWDVQIRGASFVLALGLTVALAGPRVRQRLTCGFIAMPLVFAAHFIGALMEDATDARLGLGTQPFALAPYVQIPLLVIVYGLPVIVPLALWYRTALQAPSGLVLVAAATDGGKPK